MGATAKRHHFISQCYLRGFAADPASPKLYVVDFFDRKSFSTSPLNVAHERDFHAIDMPGQPRDLVEKKLGEDFESELGPALRRIIEGASLADDHDRGYLFFFMALLLMKTPSMRKRISEWMGGIADFTLRGQAADPAAWEAKIARAKAEGVLPPDADAAAMRKHILEGNFEYGVSVPGHMYFEFRLAPTFVPWFEQRKWMLIKAPRNSPGFITSDNPVCVMWQDPSLPMPAGLGMRRTQIVFPVASELAMVGTYEDIGSPVVNADAELIAVINGNVLPYVNRQVYARDEHFAYAMPHNDSIRYGGDLLNDPVTQREFAS